MSEDKFEISEREQRRLIIDLLIKMLVDNALTRDHVFHLLSQTNEEAYEALRETFLHRQTERDSSLRAYIFEHYGKIDLSGILDKDISNGQP